MDSKSKLMELIEKMNDNQIEYITRFITAIFFTDCKEQK